MAQKLFSESLSAFKGELQNKALHDSILDLKRYLGVRTIRLLQWSDELIALSITVSVELPPLGNFDGIDIRSREPLLIVVDPVNYPRVAPIVFPDRLKFPKDSLAHLYIARNGKPPAFCMVRGDLAEWYSNKRLKDLYIRVGNWLQDAATGQLTQDGDQFDPVRLEGYISTMIYDYDQLATVVNEKQSFEANSNFAIAQFERIQLGEKFGFRLKGIVTPEKIKESLEEFNKENEKSDDTTSKRNYHYGYVVWSESSASYSKYQVNLPEDWNGIKSFCTTYGIPFQQVENQIAYNDQNVFVTIPLIIAVRRPKKIIGFSAEIEFFNFTVRVNTGDTVNGAIVQHAPVAFYKHAQPLSKEKAELISGSQVRFGSYALVAGCGALGSKIVMHFARSGATNFLLVDPDEISPHNLVRHALLGNSEGFNKAEALYKEIRALYPHDKLGLLRGAAVSAAGMLGSDLAKYFNWVLDFTASHAFSQSVVQAKFEAGTRIVRAFITDFGNLGMVCFEGKDRNPRIDDLQVMLYGQHERLPLVSSWLKRETEAATANNLSITIGVGCNSETTVLSDDLVSLHAAYIASVIKSETQQEHAVNGKIFLNEIHHEPFFSNRQQLITVPPLDVFSAINNPEWQIRIKRGIIDEMKREMGLAMPSETGGVFIGCMNYKNKTIHVTELVKAPNDSKANAACFFRGVEGLPARIGEINAATGNQLGYIGEWHTHPFGPNTLSTTDAAAIRKFKKEFDSLQTQLPVFLMIVTPDNVLPYVY
jgi:hypothetical protein